MTSVVDASVFVSALVDPGPEGQWSEIAMISDDLAGPELALAEACNLLRRLEQSSLITRSEADRLHEQMLRVEIRLFGYGPYAERIWKLRSNLTCYDAWYVALAEDLNCPLITLDLRLSRSTGPTCEFVTPPPGQTSE